MAGYWPSFFFWVFMDLDFVSIHKNTQKKRTRKYLAILTSRLINNAYVTIFNCKDSLHTFEQKELLVLSNLSWAVNFLSSLKNY